MIRTAESVSPMHPDKICDRISDAILDEALRQDPASRAAVETMGGHGIITVTGEMTTEAFVDVRKVVQGIVGDKYGVQVNIVRQSPEIAKGVDSGGAGDQGIMVGYACNETPEMMPLEVMMARKLNQFIFDLYPYDGKTQVTMVDRKITAIVASFQNVTEKYLAKAVKQWMEEFNMEKFFAPEGAILVNPAGDWEIGGFDADTGVTGRKLAVDAYGPRIPIGGGAFSGKDATKVDRSAAYMARKIAVDYLRDIGAAEVLVYLAYAIGRSQPVQATVRTVDADHRVTGYDLSPQGIIGFLDLRKPQFEATAQWGHFGNGFKWDL